MSASTAKFTFVSAVFILSGFLIHPQSTVYGAYNDDLGFKNAADLLNRGRYLESLGVYQEIVSHSGQGDNRARALLYMGTIYGLFLDQYSAALTQYDRVIREYPDSKLAPEALFNRGTVLYENGRFKQAYLSFTQYREAYPDGKRRQSAEIWADSARNRVGEKKPAAVSPSLTPVSEPTMRVLIKDHGKHITLESEMALIVSGVSGKKLYSGLGPVAITQRGSLLLLNGRSLDSDRCRVESNHTTIALDGHRFRGTFAITAEAEGIRVINHLPPEQYLYGVVPGEMSPGWPKETLMAQAVAARTYALYVQSKSRDKAFDVISTTSSQVYGGYDAEAERSNSAVDLTRGQVITHKGKLIVAYFHSNSGGHTEDAKNVWSADLPYLKGSPDRFSAQKPGSTWDYVINYKDLSDRLNRYGMDVGNILALEPIGKTRSGRISGFKVISDKGSYELKSNAFRLKMGATALRSTLLGIETDRSGIRIKGKGYGHGVGMSQWGARQMAEEGFGYQDILKHYYRDVEIVALTFP